MILETYSTLAEEIGIDVLKFNKLFNSEEMKEKVKEDFKFAQNLQATSFPTVILKSKDQYYLVSRGYTTSDTIVENVRAVLNK